MDVAYVYYWNLPFGWSTHYQSDKFLYLEDITKDL